MYRHRIEESIYDAFSEAGTVEGTTNVEWAQGKMWLTSLDMCKAMCNKAEKKKDLFEKGLAMYWIS